MQAFSQRLAVGRCVGVGLSEAGQLLCVRSITGGVDSLRQLLREHRQGVAAEAAPSHATPGLPPSFRAPDLDRGAAASLSNHDTADLSTLNSNDSTSSKSASLIKDLLRIFTRKVPGGLVPDGLVRGFMQAYTELRSPQERLTFFHLVSSEMGLSVAEVKSAVRLWDMAMSRATEPAQPDQPTTATTASAPAAAAAAAHASPDFFPDAVYRAADRLSGACRPLYTQLFLPISQAPDGMKFLVDMRAQLLQLLAAQPPPPPPAAAAQLWAMADHLRQALAEWFSVGLLHLQPISWQDSPAALLERVMRYEAVHPLGSWEELRRRLGPRRAVFAFTHPCMPGEPLVVLHTALMQRPAAVLSEILEAAEGPATASVSPSDTSAAPAPPPAPSSAALPPPTTAVFYSISATQPGLRGIELGQFLIKQVAELLMSQHPTIRQLVTLSPLPNFRSWLASRLRQEQQQGAQLPHGSAAAMAAPAAAASAAAVGAPARTASAAFGEAGIPQERAAATPSASSSSPSSSTPTPSLRAPAAVVVAEEEPLLRPDEQAAVLHLARRRGWAPCGVGDPWVSDSAAERVDATTRMHASPSSSTAATTPRATEAAAAAAASADVGAASLGGCEEGSVREVRGTLAGSSAHAAAALSWLLEEDRWLLARGDHSLRNINIDGAGNRTGSAACSVERHGGCSTARDQDPAGPPPHAQQAGAEEACEAEAVLRPLLLRLAARYLLVEKRRRFALCPVAHFHLRNGASLWRLNWRADMSPLGLQRSFGIMVNYDYHLPAVYDNNRKYLLQHEVQAHARVLQILKGAPV